jgi:hypothetical protein
MQETHSSDKPPCNEVNEVSPCTWGLFNAVSQTGGRLDGIFWVGQEIFKSRNTASPSSGTRGADNYCPAVTVIVMMILITTDMVAWLRFLHTVV